MNHDRMMGMVGEALSVPQARPARRRSQGLLPIARLLPKKVAYVLAGGGAHGSVQWGSLQAVSETDLSPSDIVGTSAGALTGVIIAEDPLSAVNRLAYVWNQLQLTTVIGDSWLSMIRSAARGASSLAEAQGEREALHTILQARTFAELDLPFAAVATDLATGMAHSFTEGDLIEPLMASSAIPGILPPVTVNGRVYVDGLVSANLPATLAVERGAEALVVFDTGSRPLPELSTSPTKVVARVSSLLSKAQRRQQLLAAATDVPVLLLPTPRDLGRSLDFSGTNQAAANAYEYGRQFLADLARKRRPLAPGLYGRAADLEFAAGKSQTMVVDSHAE